MDLHKSRTNVQHVDLREREKEEEEEEAEISLHEGEGSKKEVVEVEVVEEDENVEPFAVILFYFLTKETLGSETENILPSLVSDFRFFSFLRCSSRWKRRKRRETSLRIREDFREVDVGRNC